MSANPKNQTPQDHNLLQKSNLKARPCGPPSMLHAKHPCPLLRPAAQLNQTATRNTQTFKCCRPRHATNFAQDLSRCRISHGRYGKGLRARSRQLSNQSRNASRGLARVSTSPHRLANQEHHRVTSMRHHTTIGLPVGSRDDCTVKMRFNSQVTTGTDLLCIYIYICTHIQSYTDTYISMYIYTKLYIYIYMYLSDRAFPADYLCSQETHSAQVARLQNHSLHISEASSAMFCNDGLGISNKVSCGPQQQSACE